MEHRAGIVVVIVFCVAWQANAQVNCTTAGRFADPSDATCQNYTLCTYISSNDTFLSYNYVCPTTSVFNPITSQCTSPINYACTITNTTTTSICTADGFIADPAVTDCSSYIQCVDDGTGTFTQTNLPCPTGTFYDPNTTLCESNYNCTTTFTCTVPGRFANSADTTCQSYYFCVLATNGTFVQYNYTCPTTSVFSPIVSLCTTTYTCPTSIG